MAADRFDLVVVGAGPGGYVAAARAAQLGMKVSCVERKPRLGGVCLNVGCIPSKALLDSSEHYWHARTRLSDHGVRVSDVRLDLAELMSRKEKVVEGLTESVRRLLEGHRVEVFRGSARLAGPQAVEVAGLGGGQTRRLEAAAVLLASGSEPVELPGLPFDGRLVVSSTEALSFDSVPKHLVIVGGGYIGLELGSVYAMLGSKVTVVEMTSSLLPGVDEDLVGPLSRRLSSVFESILVDSKVARFDDQYDRVRVVLEGRGIENPEQDFDRVLVSIGRTPNSQDLGLEHTRVDVDEAGFVRVDTRLRTSDPSIFAIGDLVGQPMLAHKASHEGRTAVEVIAGRNVVFEPRAIPAVVFTDPEIAWCGLTEMEARKLGRNVEVVRFPWAASGRAMTMERTEGLTKMLLDPESERVLGVGITGSGAGELISEGVLAVEMGAEATDVKLAIHPHPTLSETFMEAAEIFFGQSTHVYRPRKRQTPIE